MDKLVVYSLPFVTALIGWFTNKVAVWMLFHPKRPVSILGFRWQGLIPRRQNEIAEQTGEVIEQEILQKHLLSQSLREMDLQPHFHQFIDELIGKALITKLKAMPFIGNFLNDGMVQQFTEMAKAEVDTHSVPFVEKVAADVEHKIHVKELVEERIKSLDLDDLERLVHKIASKEFRRIELLGGVLGFIIGVIQLLLLFWTGHILF